LEVIQLYSLSDDGGSKKNIKNTTRPVRGCTRSGRALRMLGGEEVSKVKKKCQNSPVKRIERGKKKKSDKRKKKKASESLLANDEEEELIASDSKFTEFGDSENICSVKYQLGDIASAAATTSVRAPAASATEQVERW